MVSYIKSIYNYFFPNNSIDNSDDEREEFLAGALIDLEMVHAQEHEEEIRPSTPKIPRSTVCFQRTGTVI